MFSCLKDYLLIFIAVVIGFVCIVTVVHIYRIALIGPESYKEFLGIDMESWFLLGLSIIIAIVFYFYHRHTARKIKELENKFSAYLKDLDEINEEWADENEELWDFVENTLKEKNLKKLQEKAKNLLNQRNKGK